MILSSLIIHSEVSKVPKILKNPVFHGYSDWCLESSVVVILVKVCVRKGQSVSAPTDIVDSFLGLALGFGGLRKGIFLVYRLTLVGFLCNT